jgi:hypothetical protein
MKNREEAAVFLKNAPEDDLEFKGSPSISNIATPDYATSCQTNPRAEPAMTISRCTIEMSRNHSLRVRIPSKPFRGVPLPEAVFTFRVGDPQYEYWRQRYEKARHQHSTEDVKRGQPVISELAGV